MEMNEIAGLIGSLGFPIFCCIMLFKQNEELRHSIDALKEVLIELKGQLTGSSKGDSNEEK